MGLAERADGTFKRSVALKLPHVTWIGGLAERMARERDILATLEHPNIARLYDAGVDDLGRPFMAMEYVEGVTIDRYCAEHSPTVEQILPADSASGSRRRTCARAAGRSS